MQKQKQMFEENEEKIEAYSLGLIQPSIKEEELINFMSNLENDFND